MVHMNKKGFMAGFTNMLQDAAACMCAHTSLKFLAMLPACVA